MRHNLESTTHVKVLAKSAVLAILVFVLAVAFTTETRACAIFTVARDGKVLMGNNEDYVKPGVIWFQPGKKGRYGRVNVGFDSGFAQGSMNEKGLSFDSAALPEVPWVEDPDKKTPKNLLEKIMNECATVEDALSRFKQYNCKHLAAAQFMLADASGTAVVVAWLPGQGLSIVPMEGDIQVVTNTRLEASGYRCQRFVKASQVLASMRDASLETMTSVLDAIHQRGPGAYTSYSIVYDLTDLRVHVYNLANFDEVVEFDLMEELRRNRRRVMELAALFENSPPLEAVTGVEQRQHWDTRVALDDALLDRYEGFYSPAPGITVEVERDAEGGLRVINPGQPTATLFPESETLFRIAPDRGQVSFRVTDDGRVEGLTLHKQADVFAERVEKPRIERASPG